jgi:hypothetical protein
LTEKGQLLTKPDHEVMAKFINGLPEKFAYYVRTNKPKDSSEALTIAKTGEAYKYREPQLTISAALASNPSEMDNIKTQMTQLTELVKYMYTNLRVNSQSKRASDAKQPFQNTAAYSTQHRSYTCFKCNGTGHVKRKNVTGMAVGIFHLRVFVSFVVKMDILLLNVIYLHKLR